MAHSIQYEISRAVASGYTLGALHTFAPKLRDKDEGRKSNRKRTLSLDGTVFTTYYGGVTSWSLETVPIGGTDAALVRMFLQSVEDGQVFMFDPANAPGASPGAYRAVVLDTESYTPTRRVRRGNGGASDLFVYEFRLLEVR